MNKRTHSSSRSSPAVDETTDSTVSTGGQRVDETTLERWLYAGESVCIAEPLASGWVAVTTHRLLVYTPDTEGAPFVSYDRPNVDGVRLGSDGDARYLTVLPRPLVYGFVSVGSWVAFRQAGLATLLDVDAGDSLAVVGMAGLFDTIRTALQFLELALLVGGLLTLTGAAVLGVLSLRSRTTHLVVDTGDGPVTHPLPDGVAETVSLDRLREALDRG
jgi:hypothetical protein